MRSYYFIEPISKSDGGKSLEKKKASKLGFHEFYHLHNVLRNIKSRQKDWQRPTVHHGQRVNQASFPKGSENGAEKANAGAHLSLASNELT